MPSIMMSQSLSTYPLQHCVISVAQFASGEISFYDNYVEVSAADAEGHTTSPLRVSYGSLQYFRIIRAQGLLRLTLPHALVAQWALTNQIASQMEEMEAAALNAGPSGGTHNIRGSCLTGAAVEGSVSRREKPHHSLDAIVLVQLSNDHLRHFLETVAPLVAATRRCRRSISRLSVTEPLPLLAPTFANPAVDDVSWSDRSGEDGGGTLLSSSDPSHISAEEGGQQAEGSPSSTAAAADDDEAAIVSVQECRSARHLSADIDQSVRGCTQAILGRQRAAVDPGTVSERLAIIADELCLGNGGSAPHGAPLRRAGRWPEQDPPLLGGWRNAAVPALPTRRRDNLVPSDVVELPSLLPSSASQRGQKREACGVHGHCRSSVEADGGTTAVSAVGQRNAKRGCAVATAATPYLRSRGARKIPPSTGEKRNTIVVSLATDGEVEEEKEERSAAATDGDAFDAAVLQAAERTVGVCADDGDSGSSHRSVLQLLPDNSEVGMKALLLPTDNIVLSDSSTTSLLLLDVLYTGANPTDFVEVRVDDKVPPPLTASVRPSSCIDDLPRCPNVLSSDALQLEDPKEVKEEDRRSPLQCLAAAPTPHRSRSALLDDYVQDIIAGATRGKRQLGRRHSRVPPKVSTVPTATEPLPKVQQMFPPVPASYKRTYPRRRKAEKSVSRKRNREAPDGEDQCVLEKAKSGTFHPPPIHTVMDASAMGLVAAPQHSAASPCGAALANGSEAEEITRQEGGEAKCGSVEADGRFLSCHESEKLQHRATCPLTHATDERDPSAAAARTEKVGTADAIPHEHFLAVASTVTEGPYVSTRAHDAVAHSELGLAQFTSEMAAAGEGGGPTVENGGMQCTRKEHLRRVMRYLSIITHNLAMLHEVSMELQGSILGMVDDGHV